MKSEIGSISTFAGEFQLSCFLLGSGSFGQVYIATNVATKQKVAVKVASQQNIQMAINQSNILKKLNQYAQNQGQSNSKSLQNPPRNVLKFLGTVRNYNQLYIVTEYFGDPLSKCFQSFQNNNFKTALLVFYQILKAYKPLRQLKILHRDLKPANILLKRRHEGFQIKLCDFGLAITQIQGRANIIQSERVGTIIYEAPEIIKFRQYSEKSQIWSLGIIFYQLLYKQLPFLNKPNMNLQLFYDTIISNQIKFKGVPKQIARIGERCLSINVNKRISFEILYNQIQAINIKIQNNDFEYAVKPIKDEKQKQTDKEKKSKVKNEEDMVSISTDHFSSTQQNISKQSNSSHSIHKNQPGQLVEQQLQINDKFISLLLKTYQQLHVRLLNQVKPKKHTTALLLKICQQFLDKQKSKQYLNYFSPEIVSILYENIKKMKMIFEYTQDEKQISFNLKEFMLVDTMLILYEVTKFKFQGNFNPTSKICISQYIDALKNNLQFEGKCKSMNYYKQLRNKVCSFQ